ncbi:LysR family transcriptional regulator [Pseudomonas corrugata]|uniref:LysR family transcriptional regulator n=1 Tax=Pseudomonas corrugata TaxID=47879 RepID=UPI00223465DF|nr:LysR substrate-binding domain-containing protein [Pseudomonas corrugata]UZE06979.1 LysR substrate-binding domain-containing protein [Pseudomonas corrugata]
MHFDLTDLRLYVNILDTGNITAGAARSHLSLAAASARVRAMEASLGTELLARGRRGVTPTPAGKAMAQHARVLLQHAEHLQQDLAEYAKGVKGRVRLLCNTSAMSEHLPELLATFLKDHPNLDIDLQELPSSRITHALRQGAADLGVVSDAVDTDDATNALAVYLEEQALHTGLRMRIRIRADGFDGVIRMVAHGAGIAIVPKATIERRPAEPSYRCVPLHEAWAQRALLLAACNFEALPAYAKALAVHLSEH